MNICICRLAAYVNSSQTNSYSNDVSASLINRTSSMSSTSPVTTYSEPVVPIFDLKAPTPTPATTIFLSDLLEIQTRHLAKQDANTVVFHELLKDKGKEVPWIWSKCFNIYIYIYGSLFCSVENNTFSFAVSYRTTNFKIWNYGLGWA